MSKIIEIETVQPGMILKKSIYNRFGQMILPEGTKLEEKHKRILKTWGVKAVPVVDDADLKLTRDPEYDDEIKEKAEEILKRKMCWSPRNELESSMYQIAMDRIIQKLLRQQNDIT